MLKSMTAFGRGRSEGEDKDITVEIKSVNSRYFDCTVKCPRVYSSFEEKIKAYFGRDILVQGVIDCIIERRDGSLILCDYKTDRLTKEELSDRSLAEEKLKNKHAMQLGIYSLAIEKIFEKAPSEVKIYSLPLGDTVSVK